MLRLFKSQTHPQSSRRPKDRFKELSKELEEVILLLRSGAVDPLAAVKSSPGVLKGVLRDFLDRGETPLEGLEAFLKVAKAAKSDGRQGERLKALVFLRTLSVVGIASLLRLGLILGQTSPATPGAFVTLPNFGGIWQQFFGTDFQGGLLLGLWGVALVLMSLPRSWVWAGGWSPLSLSWLQSYVTGEAAQDDPWCEALGSYGLTEIQCGVSLFAEKKRVLLDYADRQQEDFKNRLTLIEELLPLWELVILGPILFLAIALPSVRWLLG